MSATTTDKPTALVARISDKARLRKILEEQDKVTGFVMDLSMTPKEVRTMMIAQGVKPEDNSFSCEIIRARNSED